MTSEVPSAFQDAFPERPGAFVEVFGYRFHAPFRCLCCGTVISQQQFMFSTICGSCDRPRASAPPEHGRGHYHDDPSWGTPFREGLRPLTALALGAEWVGGQTAPASQDEPQ